MNVRNAFLRTLPFISLLFCIGTDAVSSPSSILHPSVSEGNVFHTVNPVISRSANAVGLVPNKGQWGIISDAGALHAVSTLQNGARIFFFDHGFSLVHEGLRTAERIAAPTPERPRPQNADVQAYRVDYRFAASRVPNVLFAQPTGVYHHFYSADVPAGIVQVAAHRELYYEDIYPGIDFHCELSEEGLKYEFLVAPGADPRAIVLETRGAGSPTLGTDGALHFSYTYGELRDDAPWVYQDAGRGEVHPYDASWMMDGNTLSFSIAEYDRSRPLVIDPFLQWSTFMGGTLSDYARDVALGKDGDIYTCGYTAGADFPVSPGALQGSSRGNFEVFVSAFSRERKQLWSTYYGGTGSEENPQIALAADGTVYVAGSTSSTDLPVSPQAQQPRSGGRYDVFLLALNPQGQRKWATYLGGSYTDECSDITVSRGGAVYLVGGTYSTNFPVTPNAIQTSNAGDYDMFVAQVSAAGVRQWASYIGGWSMDFAAGITVDAKGDMYLTGRTESTNLPAISKGLQTAYGGGSFDAFVLRIDGRTKKLLWSTYLGGEQEDNAERIDLDGDGNIVVSGHTASKRFPLKGNSAQSRLGGLIDGFIASMDPKGALRWSTYLGGVEVDKVTGLSVDVHGNLLLAGFTGSKNFPVAGSTFQKEKGGGYDMFMAQFSAAGAYLWGTLYGGETHDICYGLGTDADGNAVVVGGTESRGFRTAGNIFQGDLSGLTDAFVLRVIFNEPVASAGRDTTICMHGSALLGGGAGGGRPPYQYQWGPTTSLSDARSARPVATPTRTTDYILRVTDAEGAVALDTVTISVAPLPTVDAGEDRAICPGSSVTLQVSARGGRGPYRFLWKPTDGLSNPESANPIAQPVRSTRYVVQITDALGCVSHDSIFVRVHPDLAIETGGSLTACANAPSQLQATVTGGSAPFRFQWQPAAGLDDPSSDRPVLLPRSNATYVVTVTDGNGCTAKDTLRVRVHQPPVVDAGDQISLCFGEKGKLRARISGGKKPYTYQWNPRTGLSSAVIASPEVLPETTALYVLSVTDGNGCTVHDSVLVTVHPQPSLVIIKDLDVCAGAQIQIGAEATGGTPPFRYRWNPSVGLSNPNSAMPLASPKRSTTYTMTATDANGCSISGTVRVNTKPRPTVRLRDRHRICYGSSASLAATVRGGTPPYSYSWTPVVGLSATNVANPVAMPATSTTYTLQVTDAVGCVVEKKVDVDVLTPPVVNAGMDITLCKGTPMTLDARVSGGKPPYRAVWSPSTGLNSVRRLDPTVRTSTSRSYMLTITDANGCVARDSITVYVAPPPRANAGVDTRMCAGSSTALSATVGGGTPPYTYSWSPTVGMTNATSPTPTVRPERSTTYTLTVTDSRGCVDNDEVTVSVFPAPRITAPREVSICRDQGRRLEVTASGGKKPYRYEWTPATGLSNSTSARPVANPIQTTTYTVAVIDANGCRAFTTITVTVLPCNKADAGDDADLCSGDDHRLGPAVIDTLYGAIYRWSPATGLSNSRTAAPLATPAKTTRYVVQKTNRYDCITRDTVVLRVSARPSVSAGKDVNLCAGGLGELRATVKGGTPPYRYDWQPAAGLNSTEERRVRAAPAQTTRYTVTVTDARGCSSADSVMVRVAEPLRIAMERDVSTCEGRLQSLGGEISGGNPPYAVFWSPARGLDDRKSAAPTLSAASSIRYSVTVTDANGCQLKDTVHVQVFPAPLATVNMSGKATLCAGERVTLSAPQGYAAYRWSHGPSTQVVTITEKGEYTVTVTDARGCSATSTPAEIEVLPLPRAAITALGPTSFCEGDSVVLDAGKGFASYAWSNGNSSRRIAVHRDGNYRVEVTTTEGCSASSQDVAVTVRPVPTASFLRRQDTLIAFPAPRYQWLRDGRPIRAAQERILIIDQDGSYVLRTENEEGCAADSRAMKLSFADATVRVPRLTARKGDTIDIVLQLARSRGLDKSGASEAVAHLNVKKKTLRVISGGHMLSDESGMDRVHIPVRYTRGSKILAVVKAEVIAESGRIPMKLQSLRWSDALVHTVLRDGHVTIRK